MKSPIRLHIIHPLLGGWGGGGAQWAVGRITLDLEYDADVCNLVRPHKLNSFPL